MFYCFVFIFLKFKKKNKKGFVGGYWVILNFIFIYLYLFCFSFMIEWKRFSNVKYMKIFFLKR